MSSEVENFIMYSKIKGIYSSYRVACLGVLLTTMVGCAHSPLDHSLNGKLSEEVEVSDYAQMKNESRVIIEKAPITDEQKNRLLTLKLETAKKMDQFDKDLLKLKGVLLRNIVSEKYAPKEVVAIEKKIESLSKEKLATFFGALEMASKILGKSTAKEKVLENLRFERSFHIREGLTERY